MRKYLGYLMLLTPFLVLLTLYMYSFGVVKGLILFSTSILSVLLVAGFVTCGAYLADGR